MDHRGNMTPNALASWDALLGSWGEPLAVNSAYRDPEHNARVGGAKHSQHMHGNAFDVSVAHLSPEQRQELVRQARQAGFSGIGIYDNSLHFDVGPERAWGADYTKNSLSDEWAWLLDGSPAPQPERQTAPEPQQNRLAWRSAQLDPRDFQSQPNRLAQPMGFDQQTNPFLRFL